MPEQAAHCLFPDHVRAMSSAACDNIGQEIFGWCISGCMLALPECVLALPDGWISPFLRLPHYTTHPIRRTRIEQLLCRRRGGHAHPPSHSGSRQQHAPWESLPPCHFSQYCESRQAWQKTSFEWSHLRVSLLQWFWYALESCRICVSIWT